MEKARTTAIGLVLLVALVAPGDAAGRDSFSESEGAGALLESVIEHYQNGELEPAWEAYRAFFDDPSNRNVNIRVFSRCFFRQECPPLGALAFILGKSEAEAGDFRNFCPDWKGADKGNLSAAEIAAIYRDVQAFRDAALGGTCKEWVTRNAAKFQSRPPGHRLAPQAVSLVWFPHDSTPASEVGIFGKRVNAWMDTGATMSLLNRRWTDQFPDAVELVQNIRVQHIDFYGEAFLARVKRLELGNAVFSQPVVLFADMYFSNSDTPAPAERGNIIGMNLLLQYERVCFDWEGEKLYLGDLGPCDGGMTPYRNWLTGSQGIAVSVAVSSNEYVDMKIDTGSNKTYCSKWFMEQNTKHKTFAFGHSDALTGECIYDPDILFPSWERGIESPEKHILLGMDTLNRFAAFGWQLNPLKVYFVPRF